MRVKHLRRRVTGCAVASVIMFTTVNAAGSPELAAAIAKINANCPKSYPNEIIPVPEPGGLSDKSEAELLAMITTWNPALRDAVSSELIARGDTVIPKLKAMLESDDWKQREAAANSLSRIVQHKVRNWKEDFPEEKNWRIAQPKVRAKFADLTPLTVPLLTDSERGVRAAGLSLIKEVGSGNIEAAKATLKLFGDTDEYIAQDAMSVALNQVGVEGVDEAVVLDALAKGMAQPLPRGKGAIVSFIAKQPKPFQKKCVPLLLDHLAWIPKRDTMFGSGGQKEAIQILTKLEEPSFIPRIESVMYKKYKDGLAYFDAAVAAAGAYGPAAKDVLPTLKKEVVNVEKQIADIEKAGVNKRNKRTYDTLKARLETLKKAVQNVEK